MTSPLSDKGADLGAGKGRAESRARPLVRLTRVVAKALKKRRGPRAALNVGRGTAVGAQPRRRLRPAPSRRACPRAPERGGHRLKAAREAVIASDRRNNRSLPLKPRDHGRQRPPERVNNPPDAVRNSGS